MRFKIMETRGLEAIHEETLREINFDIGKWIREESIESLEFFLAGIFDVIEGCMQSYPEAALQILRTIGLEVVQTENKPLISFFLKRLIRLGFQTPQLGSVSQHWQIEVNPAHLPNVRIWLDIIKKNPMRTKTPAFRSHCQPVPGRDFHSRYRSVSEGCQPAAPLPHAPVSYNLVKQLAKLFPVYFNQIGAEGQLADRFHRRGRADRQEMTDWSISSASRVTSRATMSSFLSSRRSSTSGAPWTRSRLEGSRPVEVYRGDSRIRTTGGGHPSHLHHIFNSQAIHHVQDLLDLSEAEVRRSSKCSRRVRNASASAPFS